MSTSPHAIWSKADNSGDTDVRETFIPSSLPSIDPGGRKNALYYNIPPGSTANNRFPSVILLAEYKEESEITGREFFAALEKSMYSAVTFDVKYFGAIRSSEMTTQLFQRNIMEWSEEDKAKFGDWEAVRVDSETLDNVRALDTLSHSCISGVGACEGVAIIPDLSSILSATIPSVKAYVTPGYLPHEISGRCQRLSSFCTHLLTVLTAFQEHGLKKSQSLPFGFSIHLSNIDKEYRSVAEFVSEQHPRFEFMIVPHTVFKQLTSLPEFTLQNQASAADSTFDVGSEACSS